MWIAAVDVNADPSTALDPSHPAFWLPGQTESSENLTSYFAPKPCSQTGGVCGVDADCCGDGLCRSVGGVAQCVPPDAACKLTGDQCAVDADCCDGLNCINNACEPPGFGCAQTGQICRLDSDCCAGAGLCVDDGTGTTRCENDSCAQQGDSCDANRACCAGLLCAGTSCVPFSG